MSKEREFFKEDADVVILDGENLFDRLLPHGKPNYSIKGGLMVDSIMLDQGDKTRILAQKTIDHENFLFNGHYPGMPIFPNYGLDELACLAAALLIAYFYDVDGFPVVCGKNGIRYKKPVRPGDLLIIKASMTRSRNNKFFCFSALIEDKSGGLVAEYGEIIGAVTRLD